MHTGKRVTEAARTETHMDVQRLQSAKAGLLGNEINFRERERQTERLPEVAREGEIHREPAASNRQRTPV